MFVCSIDKKVCVNKKANFGIIWFYSNFVDVHKIDCAEYFSD